MTTLAQLIALNLMMNSSVVHMHADDLTTDESLIAPPDGGNPLNWTLGHVVNYREIMLAYVALEIPWGAGKYDRYAKGSAPLDNPAEALPLAEILADLDQSQTLLLSWSESVDEAALADQKEGARRDVGGQMGWYAWHESFHVGQVELQRHVAGHHESLV